MMVCAACQQESSATAGTPITGSTPTLVATSSPLADELVSCEAHETSAYVLPFPIGTAYECIQGYVGRTYHVGVFIYGVDFAMPIGTRVTAARAGQVIFVEESNSDHDHGTDKANVVIVQHEDGTYGRYIHLTEDGALVEVGQSVGQGDPIGLSGSSGDPGLPHLHFDVTRECAQPTCQTIPVCFSNTKVHPAGLVTGETYTAEPLAPTANPTNTSVAPTAMPQATAIPTETTGPSTSLPMRISQESLFTFLEGLTSIQPYSGWRNSATAGEREALDYVATILGDLTYLQNLGLELERQSFHVFLATELWETQVYLTMAGQALEVPADAPRGHRHDVVQALRFDSDGRLNDADRNPVEVSGQVLLIHSASEVDDLSASDAQDKIVFLDSAVISIDLWERGASAEQNRQIVTSLIDKGIAGLVVVTQYSAAAGNQGKLVGDGMPFEEVTTERVVPILYVRLEDLASAGISSWEQLAQIESARLVWDTDVFSPGTSGNLVARIPGADASQAIILGAHIDSANSPGAMDNGFNSVVLLEVARILNESESQPPTDLYLVWFGSEEIGLYGSQYFVNTHQELLDRTAAALLLDGIIVSTEHPLLIMDGWSHSRFGHSQLVFPNHLAQMAAAQGITIEAVEDIQGPLSDNTSFSGFVTQACLAFGSEQGDYAHSPYDTLETAQGLGDLMEQVTAVVLLATLETDPDLPGLRVTPEPDRRALLVASHTEVVHMSPAMLIDLDRALAWEGFDVDVIPYGQAVTAADLADADLVVLLPVIDYPSPAGDLTVYDEAWGESEIESLVTYVEKGGLLVLTNSAQRMWLGGAVWDANEDWPDINALAEHFGVVFEEGAFSGSTGQTQREHPLMADQASLALVDGNAVPFAMQTGATLAELGGHPVVGLVDHGQAGGQVLVLADVGILGFAGSTSPGEDNLAFLRSLARYACGE